ERFRVAERLLDVTPGLTSRGRCLRHDSTCRRRSGPGERVPEPGPREGSGHGLSRHADNRPARLGLTATSEGKFLVALRWPGTTAVAVGPARVNILRQLLVLVEDPAAPLILIARIEGQDVEAEAAAIAAGGRAA